MGVYGAYDEIFNVVDLIKGAVQPLTFLVAFLLIFIGLQKEGIFKNILLGSGVVVLVIGMYGLYDEWYAFIDMMKGVFPIFCLGFGALFLITGINKLKT
ncbi:MAG: hypothetical protein HQK53_01225 [Oligoflexia bacterium]|nr:hypothetical protein [Oligoflexia bacterium]